MLTPSIEVEIFLLLVLLLCNPRAASQPDAMSDGHVDLEAAPICCKWQMHDSALTCVCPADNNNARCLLGIHMSMRLTTAFDVSITLCKMGSLGFLPSHVNAEAVAIHTWSMVKLSIISCPGPDFRSCLAYTRARQHVLLLNLRSSSSKAAIKLHVPLRTALKQQRRQTQDCIKHSSRLHLAVRSRPCAP